jgi:hypothetical protein
MISTCTSSGDMRRSSTLRNVGFCFDPRGDMASKNTDSEIQVQRGLSHSPRALWASRLGACALIVGTVSHPSGSIEFASHRSSPGLPQAGLGKTLFKKYLIFLERVSGIEPPSSAWKAVALPLSYTRERHTKPIRIGCLFHFRSRT